MTNSESVLGSIFNPLHTGTNSVAGQGSVQMGRLIFQQRGCGRKTTDCEDRGREKRDRNREGADKDGERKTKSGEKRK